MKNLIIVLSVMLTSLAMNAELPNKPTQSIRGKVMDAVTGYPLPGAHVILKDSNPVLAASTDLNGFFALMNVPVGRQSIEVSYVGYSKRVFSNLLLNSGKETFLDIFLEENYISLNEVEIKSTIIKSEALNDMAFVSARTFSVEETERYAGSLGDPARMVANFAGVMTQNDSRNDIIIRGNSPMGVMWRIEGIEIANPNHFGAQGTTGGPVSMVNNNLLTNSDFLTGAFPAEFGNATAGVFDLNLRSGNTHKTEFVGQIGFNGFEFGAEGPAFRLKSGQKASYLANFRYSTLEVMDNLGFDFGTGAAIPQYKDFTFMADIPGTSLGRFKVFGLWGSSMIELGRNLSDTAANQYNLRGTATDFGSELTVIGTSHTYYFNANTKWKNTLSWQQFNTKTVFDSVRNDAFLPVFRGDQTEKKLSFSSHLRHKVNVQANFMLGLVIDRFEIDFVDSLRSLKHGKFITQTDARGELMLYRTYAQWQQRLASNVTANAGLHFQLMGLNRELSIEPRLGIQYQVSEKNSLNVGFGIHSQLQPKELYFFQSYFPETDSYKLGNQDVKMTRSMHYVLGYQYLENTTFRIKSEAYFQYLYRIPVREASPEFSMVNTGDFFSLPKVDSLTNRGRGRNLGVELTVERFLKKGWYMLFTASVFDSKYTGYDGVWRNTAFNGNYVFNLLGGYEFKAGKSSSLTIDLKTVWAGGKRYIPVDLNESQIKGEEVRDKSQSFENRYDDYFRTDLRFGFRVNHKNISQEWAIELQNISGYRSIFMESYDPRKNEMYQVYQQGFMPMFLYRIQF